MYFDCNKNENQKKKMKTIAYQDLLDVAKAIPEEKFVTKWLMTILEKMSNTVFCIVLSDNIRKEDHRSLT